jgi:hypothetical protein
MLSPKLQLSLKSAKEYFREHLGVGDYYAEGQTIEGEWFGKAAVQLGLKDTVEEKEFLSLCDGLNPTTGERLTARKNSVRVEEGEVVALIQDVRIITAIILARAILTNQRKASRVVASRLLPCFSSRWMYSLTSMTVDDVRQTLQCWRTPMIACWYATYSSPDRDFYRRLIVWHVCASAALARTHAT